MAGRQGDRLVLGDGGNVKIIDSLEQAVEGAGGTWRGRVICGDPDAEAGSVQVLSLAQHLGTGSSILSPY